MKLTMTGRHLDLSTAARQQIARKLSRLERLMNESAVSAQCILSLQRGLYVCELTVHAREDHMLHGLGRDAQMARAVTLAVQKVAQQAQRLKGRWTARRRSTNGAGHRAQPAREPAVVDRPKVFRSRRSAVKPMSLDDAMLSLSEGASNFLVFRDAASEGLNILYRRPDGHYGLIDPEA